MEKIVINTNILVNFFLETKLIEKAKKIHQIFFASFYALLLILQLSEVVSVLIISRNTFQRTCLNINHE